MSTHQDHQALLQRLSGIIPVYPGAHRLLPALLLLATLAAPAPASDAYLPFVESLQSVQQRAYAQAAPSGQDEPLTAPRQPLTREILVSDVRPESRLETLAEDKSGLPSLDESQQNQALDTGLSQFGYDIFNRVPSTFAPVDGIPVPADYRIGPGDNIIVQLYGKRNVEYKLVVNREGNILVPEYGPVKAAGLTFDEAEQVLTEGFERRVIGTRAVMTMGSLRTIQVRLAGDVSQPGTYTIGGLSSLIDALLVTGGVRPSGSLRGIELIRGSRRIARLDLYDLLLRGHSGDDLYLSHNDTIFVPPIGSTITVGGEVQRPAIYELAGETTVGEVIAMAGGLLPSASLQHSHIERIRDSGSRTLIDFSAVAPGGGQRDMLKLGVRNGDMLRILPLEDELQDVVLLSGRVKRPGGFQYRPGMRVSDLITSIDRLLPGADVDSMLIKREQRGTLRTEVLYANLLQALAHPGSAVDLLLQPRDQLIVFDLAKDRAQSLANVVRELEIQATARSPAPVIDIRGALRFGGRLPLQQDARLLDVIALAGGTLTSTDMDYGVIARTRYPGTDIQVLPFSIAAALAAEQSSRNPSLAPGDRLYFFDAQGNRSELMAGELDRLRQQASYGADEQLVTIVGEVRHAGSYPLHRDMRASDLLCAAQGLSHKAYGLGVTLSRVKRDAASANTVSHITLDSVELLSLCETSRVLARGDVANAARAALSIDEQRNPLLQPLDQLSFVQKPGWVERANVTLAGEVSLPGVYAIDAGETLCQVMARAGGLTPHAYTFGARFTRRSVRTMQQQTLDELQGQLDDLMVELSLSHSFNNEEKSSPQWSAKQDYLKTIRQLERAEATGRMVIDLEKVLKCRKRYDLALEDGDVLEVPGRPDHVQVAGQVYVPTSHLYRDDRRIADYVQLSGGHTVLGRLRDTYVIQANGEVLNYRRGRSSSRIARKTVMPGARIYVPLDVDRMNATEKAQSWVSSLVQSAILAGIVL